MENKFFYGTIDKFSFDSFLQNTNKSKVGFYSVGLYPASLAYNCAMHSKELNILLAPRPGRELFGAFSEDVLSNMEPKIIEKIIKMASPVDQGSQDKYNTLESLILNCDIVILASNSNHIQDDIELAIKLKEDLGRENIVLTCLVGSFCIDKSNNKPFILCEKYPDLAFFTGFHRHGALRNRKDSFSANFCHPDSLTSFLGTQILNNLSPKIRVSAGVHNIECQYIKAIKNISSIFAGFVNKYHSDKPGMLPTINTVLLSQCFDQAASISTFIRSKINLSDQFISLKELGYGVDSIKALEINKDKNQEKGDFTFSQLNAVTADVLGSMSLPVEGKPTRNFQAGQVLSEMILKLKRCPNDIDEFINWCERFYLSKGDLEGLKSLKFWPYIYEKYFLVNHNCSMINLIYICFYANYEEKKYIYEVLTDEEEIINYCQESVKPYISNEICKNSSEDFKNNDLNILTKHEIKIYLKNKRNEEKYFKVMKIVDKYFKN